MSDDRKLRIHTQARPDLKGAKDGSKDTPAAAGGGNDRPNAYVRNAASGGNDTSGAAGSGNGAPNASVRPVKVVARTRRMRPKLSRGDRLMRNSAIACALLLGILALGNVDAPWAREASARVERALTMRIDLDDSIGALQFVRSIMPESALVFMNISAETPLAAPVAGGVSHPWSSGQPWLMYDCDDDAPVSAAASGTVTAVSALSGGRWGVLVDHGEGVETVYACLSRADVAQGDPVERGQALGAADAHLYFEYRSGGAAEDPTAALGL